MNSDGVVLPVVKPINQVEILNVTSIHTLVKEKKQIDILYKLGRLVRNTDALGPASWGNDVAQLLVQLRLLDGERYAREIMEPKKVVEPS